MWPGPCPPAPRTDSAFFSAQADFRDYPPLLRQAVSIARKIQDPLMEYAQVCSTDEDILCLKLHPLQVRSEISSSSFLALFATVLFCLSRHMQAMN